MIKAAVGGETGNVWPRKAWKLPEKEADLQKQDSSYPPAELLSAPKGVVHRGDKWSLPQTPSFYLWST